MFVHNYTRTPPPETTPKIRVFESYLSYRAWQNKIQKRHQLKTK